MYASMCKVEDLACSLEEFSNTEKTLRYPQIVFRYEAAISNIMHSRLIYLQINK